MEVERVTTPLARFEMGEALVAGHRRYFGRAPTLLRLAVAWSQCALEHAAGEKLYNFNLGNVTAGSKYEGDVYVMHVPPPDPPVLRFRAFASAELGAVDYWTMLDGHYRSALLLFDTGRAYEAAGVLGKLGYYTADPKKYAAGVQNWKAWFDAHLASQYAPELAEGRGNSLLTEQEIAEVIASQFQLRIDDPILPDAPRDRDTQPELAVLNDVDELAPSKS